MKKNIKDLVKQYDKNGWTIVKNFFSEEQVVTYEKTCFEFLKKNFSKYSGRDINFSGEEKKFNCINSFHRATDITIVKKLSKLSSTSNIIKKFLKKKPVFMNSEIFAKPPKTGLKSPAHQDNHYWAIGDNNALTVWIAIDGSTKKNGGVYYFNGSHKLGVLSHKPSFAKGSSQTVKNLKNLKKLKKFYPSLERGDALIHHCCVVHGSEPNKSKKSRRGLTLQFKSLGSEINKKLMGTYLKELKQQIKFRKSNARV